MNKPDPPPIELAAVCIGARKPEVAGEEFIMPPPIIK